MSNFGKIAVRSLSELVNEVATCKNEVFSKKIEECELVELPKTPQKIRKNKKASTTSRKRTHTVESANAATTTVTKAKKLRSNRKEPLPGQLRIDGFYSSAAKTYKIEPRKEEPRDQKSIVTTSCKKRFGLRRNSKSPRLRRKALFKGDDESTTTASEDKKFVINSRKIKAKATIFVDLCESESDGEAERTKSMGIQDIIENEHSGQPNTMTCGVVDHTSLTGIEEAMPSRQAIEFNSVGLITPVQSTKSKASECPAETSFSSEREVVKCNEFPSNDSKSFGKFNDGASVTNESKCANDCPPDRQPPLYKLKSFEKHGKTAKTSDSVVKIKSRHKRNITNKKKMLCSSVVEQTTHKMNNENQPSEGFLEQELGHPSLHKKQNENTNATEPVSKKEDPFNYSSINTQNRTHRSKTPSPSAVKCNSAVSITTASSKIQIPVVPSISEVVIKPDKSNKENDSFSRERHHVNSECSSTAGIIVISNGEQEDHTIQNPVTSKKTGKQEMKNSAENTITKKPRRSCPPYKVVEGTTFGVDAFNYGDIDGVTHYFLTHFHADHYVGLNRKFSHPIYMSSITARLLRVFIPIENDYIYELSLNEPVVIEGVEVTAIDANHCPGAIMLIFKTLEGRCILHTGDFRASPEMESEPIFWNNDIHTIYLDTTYFPKKYAFCSQSESIDRALCLLDELNEKNVGTRILYVCGSYLVGKEKFWVALASKLELKVWAELRRRKSLEAIGDENILPFLVDDPFKAQLHVIPMINLSYWALQEYMNKYSEQYDVMLAFRPSGWEKNSKPQYRGKINIIGVEYSEHSSHDELKRFVQYLKPKKVISTVAVGKNPMKTAKIPDSWYKYDKLTGFQKEFQPSITSYFKINPRIASGAVFQSQCPVPRVPSDKITVSAIGACDNPDEEKDDDWLT